MTRQLYPTLNVRNFGPIVSGSVEAAPLSCLIGASNTGKSYLSMLLYAFHRTLIPSGYSTHPSIALFRRGRTFAEEVVFNALHWHLGREGSASDVSV